MRNIHPVMNRWQDIIAILPQYDAQDCNITCVYFEDGSRCEVRMPIETVMKEICSYFNVKQQDVVKQSAVFLDGRTRKVPLYPVKGFGLVPINARKERYTRRHSHIGYVVLQKVMMAVRENNNYTSIVFRNSSHYLTFPQSKRTVEHQLDMARQVEAYLKY